MESQLTQKLEQVVNEIRGTWRYRWTALLVAWVAASLGWFATYWIPNSYEAQARVFVDSSTALRPLLEGLAIDSGVQSQLDLVRRSLLSKPNLEKVARETGLLQRATTPQEEEWLIEQLREDIRITSEVSRGNDDLYTMSFTDVNRDKSIEVVSRLLESFMGDVIGSKAQGQESAQRFLREQIADYERRLYEAETRLADFKKKNLGLVPGERGDYFTRLQTEQDELDRSRSELQLLLRRQDQLSQQLSGEVPFIAEPGRDNEQADTTIGRLRDAETRLQELLLRFTDKHPEVVALRETIDQLRGRYDRELASLRNGESLDGSSIPRSSNPVYQRIQVSLNEVEVEIAALQTDILGRERRIADLQMLLDTAPEVEAEFARLNRDYGVTRAQYDSLVQRLETARISEMADETVRFEVIDPPSSPTLPVGPNRTLLLAASLFLGIVAGAAVAYGKNVGNPVFFEPSRLSIHTARPVLGVIGYAFPTAARQRTARDKRWLGLATASLLAVFVAAVIWADVGSAWLQQLGGAA